MAEDDDIRREQGRRLQLAREAAGYRSMRAAALSNHWKESSYKAHEKGKRTIGRDDAETYARAFRRTGSKATGQFILYGGEDSEPLGDGNSIQIMGLIGTGAIIEPEYESLGPGGLHEVRLPFAVPDGLIGFEVSGDSMRPAYKAGDVVVVWRETNRPIESFFGEEAAVRTADGRRYLKTVERGKSRSLVNLASFNAKLIENVKLEWISEIYLIVPASQVRRLAARERAGSRRREVDREKKETQELPLVRRTK